MKTMANVDRGEPPAPTLLLGLGGMTRELEMNSARLRTSTTSTTFTSQLRRPRWLGAVTLASGIALAGCNEHPLDGVDLDSTASRPFAVDLAPKNKVDVIVVVDNSGSMGEEQANLAANFGAFVQTLENGGADFRLAVITTDQGNDFYCGEFETSPEYGNMQASSCRQRLEHFQNFDGDDFSAAACTDICELDTLDLRATALAEGGAESVRPWLQAGGSDSNLPGNVTATQAFSCMGPQGVDGCGYESPLEALRFALLRTQDEQEDEYGFLRDDAALAVIIVTDEADCSTTPEGQQIFSSAGAKTFWPDPSSNSTPSSKICWSAGVECEADGNGGYRCNPKNVGLDGAPADAGGAVLRDVDEYVQLLRDLGGDNKRLHVSLIGGVPLDFGETGVIPYTDGGDPAFVQQFGIGAGCTNTIGGVTQAAVPPVRLRNFIEAFDGTQMFSVCAADYTDTLEAIVEQLEPGRLGACVPACLTDDEPGEPGVQPECDVTRKVGTVESKLLECETSSTGPIVPAGEVACFVVRGDTDGSATSEAWDDAAKYCGSHEEWNVAIELIRAEGEVAPENEILAVECLEAVYAEPSCG